MGLDRGDTMGLGRLPPQQRNQSNLGAAEVLPTDKVSETTTASIRKEPPTHPTAGKQKSSLPSKISN